LIRLKKFRGGFFNASVSLTTIAAKDTIATVATWNIRNVPDELARRTKVHAAASGTSLTKLVIGLVRREVLRGNEQRGAKGGFGQDYGERTLGGGGVGDISIIDSKTGRLPSTGGHEDMRRMRGKVREHDHSEGGDSGVGLGEVHGSSGGAQPDGGQVGGGAQPDSSGENYIGKWAHEADCICSRCLSKRGL
jgi:hypothetical protein